MRIESLLLASSLVFGVAACGDDDDCHDGEECTENEVISRVTLSFTPSGGGAAEAFVWDDPDGDGGDAPTIDDIDLTAGMYTLSVTFENALEDPAENITEEVEDEAEEHQVFLTGTAVNGPAADNMGAPLEHAYADMDANGDPIGLDNDVTAAAGTGTLTLTLRHMPESNGAAVKTSTAAADVATGGFAAIGGDNDVQIDFDVTVN